MVPRAPPAVAPPPVFRPDWETLTKLASTPSKPLDLDAYPGADRTRRYPTSQPPGHRVPDLCDHHRSSAPGLLLLPWSSSLHAMLHLPHAHHEISKHDSPNETKVKEKQNKTIPDSNLNLAKSMTHHNQTKELTTWFLTFWPHSHLLIPKSWE
jgi:hypothetical protein